MRVQAPPPLHPSPSPGHTDGTSSETTETKRPEKNPPFKSAEERRMEGAQGYRRHVQDILDIGFREKLKKPIVEVVW